MIDRPIRVLFLCTHNSARSQMAEAFLRHIGDGRFEVYSAGTDATRVHPLAVQAMAESGIEIAEACSKTLDRYVGQHFDYVITVCDQANESCPVFPGDPKRIHWSFPDPSSVEGSEEERRAEFEKVRDEILVRIRIWTQLLLKPPVEAECATVDRPISSGGSRACQ